MIDRTCARAGCEYEWGVHIATFAVAAHLTEDQVRASVLGDANAACWLPAEQALIATVDALHDRATLTDAEFKALSAHYDEAKIMEIILWPLSHRIVSGERRGLAARADGGAVSEMTVSLCRLVAPRETQMPGRGLELLAIQSATAVWQSSSYPQIHE